MATSMEQRTATPTKIPAAAGRRTPVVVGTTYRNPAARALGNLPAEGDRKAEAADRRPGAEAETADGLPGRRVLVVGEAAAVVAAGAVAAVVEDFVGNSRLNP
jgi:hypothetical protein